VQCVILAGGLATRLRPLTADTPKLLVPVAGRPFADWQLSWLAGRGVGEVVLCVGHLGEKIESYVGDGRRWGVDVTYVREGDRLRGTAGALRLALDEGQLQPAFLVLYGDSYLDVDVRAVWDTFERAGCLALMTVYGNDGRWDVSNVRCEADGRVFYDKRVADPHAAGMRHIDYGLLVLRRDVVEQVPPDAHADLADLQHTLSVRGEMYGFEASHRFYEIGSPAGLADLEQHLDAGVVTDGGERRPG
jgi:MurNAc alpha-1-phosphate uridylyltransferase